MTGTEAKMLMAYLAETWPNYKLPTTREEMAVRERAWLGQIGDLDANLAEAAIASVATREFAPSPGQIREAVDELLERLSGDGPPDTDQAWHEVRKNLRECGMRRPPRWSHPAVEEAVTAIGWRDLCMSETEDEGTWRAHFLRFYTSATARHRREAGVGLPPVVRELGRLTGELTA